MNYLYQLIFGPKIIIACTDSCVATSYEAEKLFDSINHWLRIFCLLIKVCVEYLYLQLIYKIPKPKVLA